MILIPAIDIKDGRCVRLKQGKMDEATIYSDDPLEVAKRWHVEGAQRLHVVDLDGAISGYPVHVEPICKIVQSVPLPIQIGGGFAGWSRLSIISHRAPLMWSLAHRSSMMKRW